MRSRSSRQSAGSFGWAAVVLLGCLSGCATRQVWVTPIGQASAYRLATQSALNSDTPSAFTSTVLRRYGLQGAFQDDPDGCLAEFWQEAQADSRRDALFAVAELCFLRAKRLDRPAVLLGDRELARRAYLASAFAAYQYLLGGKGTAPTAYDRRFRLACDMYNVALGRSCADADGQVSLTAGTRRTPIGDVALEVDLSDLAPAARALGTLLLADGMAVHGLEVRDRSPGLGAPLVAVGENGSRLPLQETASLSLFLECGELEQGQEMPLHGTLRCYRADANRALVVGDREVPIETDMTAAIAYSLNDPLVWKLGRRVFRLGQAARPQGIYLVEPYTPTKIPVLFVHGTMSSPFLWARMWNTLTADPAIREHYQFWFFFYNSSSPLLLSASRLRNSIREKIAELDPGGDDPGPRQMVIIGHSQGGLLARTCVTETGEELVRALSGRALDELPLSPADRQTAQELGVFSPIPNVRRVVFIATPHRGSYRATQFTAGLVRRLVRLPLAAFHLHDFATRLVERQALPPDFRTLSSSIDGMSPDSPVLTALAELPFGKDVQLHSIIPVQGSDTPPEGEDGVVAYASAHLDGVQSEFVLRDGHSCQGNPLVIEEVRRILVVHGVEAGNAAGGGGR